MTTKTQLESRIKIINEMLKSLNKQGRYGLIYQYGYTDIVFYADPKSTGCSDVLCGLTKSEAADVLYGIIDTLNVIKYRT